jgi:lactate dehydrogenase-like 2-hydroxyacid dehydrogenase
MNRLSMLITRRWPPAAEAEARKSFDVTINADDAPLSRGALADALEQYDIICPTITDRIDAELLALVQLRVRALCNFGAGVNHIDLPACARAGIIVTNTPDVLTEDTADIALLLALMTARRAGEGERLVRAGAWPGWSPTHMTGSRLSGKTLGIVGFGRIGQALARRAHFGFGMDIVYFARSPSAFAAEMDALFLPLDDVLRVADFVSLHIPGGDDTHAMINAARLALMKPGAILVNTARGDVIDEPALIAALRDRKIGGAGLDVYVGEPRVSPELIALDNVVLLPHLGSATMETRTAMGLRALANAEAIARGLEPADRVLS